jgi:hypothetical protein
MEVPAEEPLQGRVKDDETMSQGSTNSEDRCIAPTVTATPRKLTGKKNT